MGFIEDVKNFAERINTIKDNILTEEATKMSLIVQYARIRCI